jgi:autotransporter-associated beta strand protein
MVRGHPLVQRGGIVISVQVPNGGTLQTTATCSISSSNRGVTLGGSVVFSPNSGTTFTISNPIAGTGTINQTGAGTLGLSGANTYSGGTILSAGGIIINKATALGAGGNWLTIAGDGTCKIDTTASGITLSNYYPQAWNADFTFIGSSSLNLGTGQVTLGGNRQVTVNGSTLTVGGAVGGDYSLTKAGTGILTLSGSNTYTGKTIVNAGTLSISSEGGLGSNPDSFTADQLTLNGGTLQTTATCTISSSNRGVTLGSSGGTFNVSSSSATLTVSNVIAGSGLLTKAGSGVLTLSSANTYTGGTTLSAGRLNINNAAALSAGTLTISGTSTIGNTSAGLITLVNNNPQAWNANFTFAGTQDLNLGSGAVTLGGGNRTATVSANTLTVGGAIGGSYSLTKAGSGTLVLSGDNAYTGATTLSGGRLLLNGTYSGGGAFTVQSAATLGGAGMIGAVAKPSNVTVASLGMLAPGNSIGTLGVYGNVTLGGTLVTEVDGAGAGVSDLLNVLGTLDITSSSLDLHTLTPLDDPAYVLADYTTLVGDHFANVTGLPAGYHIEYQYQGGNQIALVVPEPSTLALLGVGALGLLAYVWRRRNR